MKQIVPGLMLLFLTFPALAAGERLDLPTVAGDRFFHLEELAGRPVVLNFWDTECQYCLEEMPLLEALPREHAAVVGISVSPVAATRDFLAAHPLKYTQLRATADAFGLLRRFGNPAGLLPHTAVLDREHRLCMLRTGKLTRDWLEQALARCGKGEAPRE